MFFMVLASLMLPTVDVLKIEWIWFLQESWPCQNQYIWQVGINLHLKSNVSWLPAPCFNLQINWMWTFTGSIIDVKFKVPSVPPSSLKDSNALFCVSFIHSSLSQEVSILKKKQTTNTTRYQQQNPAGKPKIFRNVCKV